MGIFTLGLKNLGFYVRYGK